MKLLHISDIHLYAFELSKAEFLTKKLFSNINYLFNRKFTHSHTPLFGLLNELNRLKVTHLLISGDLTTTASKKEYLLVKELFKTIKKQGIEIFALPGNHDLNSESLFNLLAPYTNQAKKEPFLDSRILHCRLNEKYHLILLDSTKFNKRLDAEGDFSKQMQHDLQQTLNSIDKNETILVANHFPILDYRKHKELIGRELLMDTLEKYNNVALYLHGHRHRHEIVEKAFTVVDAGCVSRKKNPSACLFDLTDEQILITPLIYRHKKWQLNEKKTNSISL